MPDGLAGWKKPKKRYLGKKGASDYVVSHSGRNASGCDFSPGNVFFLAKMIKIVFPGRKTLLCL
jgi:hypothetical protein